MIAKNGEMMKIMDDETGEMKIMTGEMMKTMIGEMYLYLNVMEKR